MNNLFERLQALTLRQRLIAGGGAAVALVVLILMVRMALSEEEALLYSGLDPAAAGEVIAALEGEGVPFAVRGTGIYVPARDRDRLRLNLARQNLPAPAAEGYELLDSLDGFSTTSEMFSATYWRAKEGELARTLMTMPGITAARVHIGAGERGAFARRDLRRTASVTVTAPSGLTDAQVRAVRYLTALAVPNLPADDVAIIDTARGLLSESTEPGGMADDRRADQLEEDLLTLLEARVGIGNARVNVSMDTVRRREEIEERSVDPGSAVVTSRDREEQRSNEAGTDGPVTVASDLPDGEAANGERMMESEEIRERVSYAVSTTDRRVELLPGGVERLSVAVLLNDPRGPDGLPVPRSAEELDALRELVIAAAGINTARGDILTIRSLSFEPVTAVEVPVSPGLLARLPVGRLAELLVIAGGLVLFGLFVVRPVLSPPLDGRGELSLLSGDVTFEQPVETLDNPVLLLRERSAERPEAAATLLNAWLDDEEKAA